MKERNYILVKQINNQINNSIDLIVVIIEMHICLELK